MKLKFDPEPENLFKMRQI